MQWFGPRIVKTALAATGAIAVAEMLDLTFSASAGILAVLGVQATRKQTVYNIFIRFTASLIGLVIGNAVMHLFGFHPWVIGLVYFIAFTLLAKIGLKDGIVSSGVVVLHLYSAKNLSVALFGNEIVLISIGLGIALIINVIYMPSTEKETERLIEKVDSLFSQIFVHYGHFLKQEGYLWSGQEIIALQAALAEGKNLALRMIENKLRRNEDPFYRYIRMREKQFDWVRRMMVLIARIHHPVKQSYALAELFYSLSEQVKNRFYSGKITVDVREILSEMENAELPKTREEFEVRASLFHLLHELDQFLAIAEKEKPVEPKRARLKRF